MRVKGLLCEYTREPAAVDEKTPLFSPEMCNLPNFMHVKKTPDFA